MLKFKIYLLAILCSSLAYSQKAFKPGFDKGEAIDAILISSFHKPDSVRKTLKMPKPKNWKLVYSSPVVGLDNKWNLWYNKKTNSCEISIRGTVSNQTSWMEDFYSGMIKSQGKIKLDATTTFNYKMANDPQAYIHAGWTIGVGFLSKTVLEKIDEYYKKGVKKFYISGHSQGGAIALLMTSYLHYHPDIPKDIQFKTYAIATPKPGNLFFSYDFASYTQEAWVYRIINAKDWVPQSPLTVETLDDVNKINPFTGIKESTKNMNPAKRIVVLSLFGKMEKSLMKSQKYLTKYLGHLTYGFIHKKLIGLEELEYEKSFDYSPCGNSIILQPDKHDLKLYENKSDSFTHHHIQNYYYLTNKL